MANDDPTADAVIGALRVALVERGSRLVTARGLDPVLEANSRSALDETMSGAQAARACHELQLVSVEISRERLPLPEVHA